jgi:hypothetical protein
MNIDEPMEACPKFNRCNVNVCPLDSGWRTRRHFEREPVCSYLLESVKVTGPQVFEAGTLAFLLARASEIGAAFPAIGRRLVRAESGGSRILRAREIGFPGTLHSEELCACLKTAFLGTRRALAR